MNTCILDSSSDTGRKKLGATNDPEQLCLGLVVDLSLDRDWIAGLIQALEDSAHARVGPVIMLEGEQASRSPREAWLFRLWCQLDGRLFSPLQLLTGRQLTGHTLDCVARSAGKAADSQPRILSAAALDELKRGNLDVIVQIGCERCIPHLAALTRYGVWWVPELAPSKLNAQWFHAISKGHSVFETLLKAYRPDGGECRILRRSFSAIDGVSLSRHRASKRRRISELVVQELVRVAKSKKRYLESLNDLAIDPDGPTSWEAAPAPTAREFIRFFVSWAIRGIGRRLQRCFWREHWFVAYRSNGGALPTSTSMKGFHVVATAKDRFYADPFSIERNGNTFLFFEDYPFDKGKGLISCLEIDNRGNCGKPQVVLEREYHLSYPHVFEHGGEMYMVPESLEPRRIDLYRAADFPGRWVFERTLLDNIVAVDPTILFHNGKVWLFASGVRSRHCINEELFLFFSDSLSGHWTSHPLNPIVSDVRRARPAGRILVHEGEIIRPAQDCSGSYGRAVTFYRIDELSETAYCETPIGKIGPEWWAGNLGTHTFNCSESIQTVDGRVLVPKYGYKAGFLNAFPKWRRTPVQPAGALRSELNIQPPRSVVEDHCVLRIENPKQESCVSGLTR
jgi:hypothetical protein